MKYPVLGKRKIKTMAIGERRRAITALSHRDYDREITSRAPRVWEIGSKPQLSHIHKVNLSRLLNFSEIQHSEL